MCLIMRFSFLVVLMFSTSLWAQNNSVEEFLLEKNDFISFFDESNERFEYGVVKEVDSSGNVLFDHQKVNFDGFSSYISYVTYRAHYTQIGLPVTEKNGFTPGQKLCFKNKPVKLQQVFSNGTGKVVSGSFIFEKWKVVELKNLIECE